MTGSEFQEVWRYLDELGKRLEKVEDYITQLPCLCKEDFTDGTAYCEQCGKERK